MDVAHIADAAEYIVGAALIAAGFVDGGMVDAEEAVTWEAVSVVDVAHIAEYVVGAALIAAGFVDDEMVDAEEAVAWEAVSVPAQFLNLPPP